MTNDEAEYLLERIQAVVADGGFVVGRHALRHSIEEGFEESDILEAISNARMLEMYPDDSRCLVLGTFKLTAQINQFLHVVVDFWSPGADIESVNIVTAYIPQRPQWDSPRTRGKKP